MNIYRENAAGSGEDTCGTPCIYGWNAVFSAVLMGGTVRTFPRVADHFFSLQLRDLVNHAGFKLRKKFDLAMNRMLPNFWVPLYGMVTFSRIPYHQVILDKKWQDKVSVKGQFNTLKHVFAIKVISHTINAVKVCGLLAIGSLVVWKLKDAKKLPNVRVEWP